jgi:FMN-dependent NADH-azoreductase
LEKLGHFYIDESIPVYRPKRQLFIFFESTYVVYSSYVVQEEFSMSKLLHIDSSPLYGRSVSRELTAAFVTQWKAAHPDGKVIYRDLNATAMPPINAEWVGAVYTPEQARTPQQKELLSLSDSLLAELEQADEYVIGVPMHNFGVPSVLKLWIDQIARVGRTFAYSEKGPKGLITGQKATFIIATGGIYDAQTRMASFNFVEPYLRSVFGFLGVTDATFLTAGGTSALNQGKDRNTFLAPHLQAVQTHAQTF